MSAIERAVNVGMAMPGLITEGEVRWLAELCAKAPRKDVTWVELGVFLGRSLSVLCVMSGGEVPVVGVDNWSYRVDCSEKAVRDGLARHNLTARLVSSDSKVVPTGVERVGLLHVDSHHVAAQFNVEMDAWMGLVPKGGIIVCHDYASPRWLEMKPVIDTRFRTGWERLGLVRRMIAFRRTV
jgi:hypothetical protein